MFATATFEILFGLAYFIPIPMLGMMALFAGPAVMVEGLSHFSPQKMDMAKRGLARPCNSANFFGPIVSIWSWLLLLV